jgi:hypothetical protein
LHAKKLCVGVSTFNGLSHAMEPRNQQAIIHGESDINRNQESQMHSPMTAVVLCVFVQAAAAQCVAPVPVAQDARNGAAVVRKTSAAEAAVRPAGGELIKAAAAGTHDELPAVTRSSPPARADADDSQRRGGPAMLWAALALMSGIALRRYGAGR